MAFLLVAAFIREHARAKPRHTVDQHERAKLAAGQHIIADGNFLVDNLVEHTLIDALIMSAHDVQMLHQRKLPRALLRQRPALRRHVDHMRPVAAARFACRLPGAVHRVGLHQHPLARSIGRVVDIAVAVHGIIADMKAPDVKIPGLARTADDTLRQHRLAHRREQRRQIDLNHRTIPPADGS